MCTGIKTTSAAVSAGYNKYHDEMSNGNNVRATPAKHNERSLESSKRKNGAGKPIVANGFLSKFRSEASSKFSGLFSRAKKETIINAPRSTRNPPVIPSDNWWSSSVSGEYVAAEKDTPGYKKFKATIALTVEAYRIRLDGVAGLVGQPTLANMSEGHTAYDKHFSKAYDSAYENLRREGKSMQEALRLTYGQANAQVLNELRSESVDPQYIALISQRELVIKEPVSKSDGKPTFPLFFITELSRLQSPAPQAGIASSKSDVSIESAVGDIEVKAFRENIEKAWRTAKLTFVPPFIASESKIAKTLRGAPLTEVELTPGASLTSDDLKEVYESAFEKAYTEGVSTSDRSGTAVLSAHQSALDKVSGNLPSFEHRMLVARFKREIVKLEPALDESKKSPSVQLENQDSVRENIVKPESPADVSRAESAMQTSGDTAIEGSIEMEKPFSLMKWVGMKASDLFSKKSKPRTKNFIGALDISSPTNFQHDVKLTPTGDSLLGGDLNLSEFQLASSVTPELKAQSPSSNTSDGEMDRISSRADSVRSRAPSLSSLASTALSISSSMSSWSPEVSLTFLQTPPGDLQTKKIPVSSNEKKQQESKKTMLGKLISILPKRSRGYKLTDLTFQGDRHGDISVSTYVSEPGRSTKADRYDDGSKKVSILSMLRTDADISRGGRNDK